MIPGEIRVGAEPIELNVGRETRTLVVVNDGDRPIQVGSHLHFAQANHALSFDREAATGFRLAVPAGTSVRFEPGVSRTVELVALGGRRYVPGIQIHGAETPHYARRPKPVVPFGTPGTDVPEPTHSGRSAGYVSAEPAQPQGGPADDEGERP